MFNRKRKIEIKNRLISLVSLLLLALLLLDMRIYYVQKKYSTKETGNFKGNHKQYENISDLNYSLLDRAGESIFQYDPKGAATKAYEAFTKEVILNAEKEHKRHKSSYVRWFIY